MSLSKSHDSARHTNRLARETSPYLLQHAHNPVDWYPWGAEAALLARIRSTYLPNKTLVLADPGDGARLPGAEGKAQIDDRVTAYHCHDNTCSPPATSWRALTPLLAQARE